MTTTPIQEEYTAMQGGLHTDSTQLAPKKGSSRDEANYELLRDGSRRRRRPILEEPTTGDGFQVLEIQEILRAYTPSIFLWEAPGHESNAAIVVENVGPRVHFYRKTVGANESVRDNRIGEPLDLRFWGSYNSSKSFTDQANIPKRIEREGEACTYTTGNGHLYIFHPNSGCIKASYDPDTNTLNFDAVGTWVRDYEGAQEKISADTRPVLTTNPADTTTLLSKWDATNDHSIPLDPTGTNSDDAKEWRPTSSLDEARAYNLSNSGWDSKSVGQFAYQSASPFQKWVNAGAAPGAGSTSAPSYQRKKLVTVFRNNKSVWPALTDFYAKGRVVDEDGSNEFSYSQLVQAKEGGSRPPMGSRITHSAISPAGTLLSEPTSVVATLPTNYAAGGGFHVDVRFDREVFPTDALPPFGGGGAAAVFVHNLVLRLTSAKYGNKLVGYSGVLSMTQIGTDARSGRLFLQNDLLTSTTFGTDWTGLAILRCVVYASPTFFPHLVRTENFYNYSGRRRPACGTFYAGRLFQGADEHERIYFGQVSDVSRSATASDAIHRESMCYMAADPTDPDDNALVPTDGGYISTSGSGTHYALHEWGGSLYLFAEGGIWMVSPGQKGVFTPSDYRVSRIYGGQVLGSRAVAVAPDGLYAATATGLLKLGREGIQNLVEGRIRDVWDAQKKGGDFPVVRYDETARKVLMLQKGTKSTHLEFGTNAAKSSILSYSEIHDSFTMDRFPNGGMITDLLVLPTSLNDTGYSQVRYQTLRFLVAAGSPVDKYAATICKNVEPGTANLDGPFRDYQRFQSITVIPEEQRESPAYMLSNEVLAGGGAQFTAIHYAIVHNQRTDTDGSTLMQCLWDFFDQEYLGKISPKQETYRPRRSLITSEPNGEPVIVAKQKVPGRGREFRVRFESSTGKDSHLIGYTITGMVLNGV